MCVLSVKTLYVTGSIRSPLPSPRPAPWASDSEFLAKSRRIRSRFCRGSPLTGFWLGCLSSQAPMTSTSKMVPSGVQTGFLKGWRLAAQKLKGRRRKEATPRPAREEAPPPAPTLAE